MDIPYHPIFAKRLLCLFFRMTKLLAFIRKVEDKATSSKASSTWTVIVPSVHRGSNVLDLHCVTCLVCLCYQIEKSNTMLHLIKVIFETPISSLSSPILQVDLPFSKVSPIKTK